MSGPQPASAISVENFSFKSDRSNSLRLKQQEKSTCILARHKLNLANSTFHCEDLGGIVCKIQTLIKLTTENIAHQSCKLDHTTMDIVDKFNPCDLNLLGCYHFFNNIDKSLLSFLTALRIIEENDKELLYGECD